MSTIRYFSVAPRILFLNKLKCKFDLFAFFYAVVVFFYYRSFLFLFFRSWFVWLSLFSLFCLFFPPNGQLFCKDKFQSSVHPALLDWGIQCYLTFGYVTLGDIGTVRMVPRLFRRPVPFFWRRALRCWWWWKWWWCWWW